MLNQRKNTHVKSKILEMFKEHQKMRIPIRTIVCGVVRKAGAHTVSQISKQI